MSDVVLFSGGCDSTLVLYRRAMEALKTNSYHRVKALSITHDQIPAQQKQKQAREAIRKEFEARQLPIDWLDESFLDVLTGDDQSKDNMIKYKEDRNKLIDKLKTNRINTLTTITLDVNIIE